MPILIIIHAISGKLSDIDKNPGGYFSKINLFLSIGIFSPYGKRGKPISLHRLR